MFRKPLFLLLLATASSSLLSCGQIDHPEQVAIEFGTMVGMDAKIEGYSHLTRIDAAELLGKVEAKENFILVAHSATRIDCDCYSNWHDDVLAPYIAKHNLLVYLIDMSEVSGEGKENYGLKLNALYATLGIFKDGKLAYQHGTSDETDKWISDRTEFASWMNYRIQMPTMFYISKDQLDQKYNGNQEFTVLFTRSTCPDCGYLSNNFLKNYLAERPNSSTGYVLDCDVEGIRYIKDETGKVWAPSNGENAKPYELAAYEQWSSFKRDYGLAYSEENPAGWSSGFVPTLYHINPEGNGKKTGDVIDGAAVLFNDSIQDGVIQSSYFTAERLELDCLSYLKEDTSILEENKVLVGKQVNPQGDRTKSLYFHEEQGVYHEPIAKVFLDTFVGN